MFQVPETKIPKTDLWFKFKLGGKTHQVRKLKYLTVGQQEIVVGGRAVDSTVLDAIFGEAGTPLGDAVRALEDDQFDALYQAWVDDSEVTPGESEGSSE